MRLLTLAYNLNMFKSKGLRDCGWFFLYVLGEGKRVILAALAIVGVFLRMPGYESCYSKLNGIGGRRDNLTFYPI